MPREKLCIDGTRNVYEEDGYLPARSFSTTSRRRRIWKHILVAVLAFILLGLPLIKMGYWPQDYDICSFEKQVAGSSISGAQSLFRINIAYGPLPFWLAKFIDVAWDVVVGRGSQVFLGWISYRVCTDCLMWIMESSAVSYDLYMTLTFSWTSLASLGPLPRFLWTRNQFSHKMVMVLLAIDIFWVGILPSVLGAMTGYLAENDRNVRLRSGKIITWADYFHAEPVYLCGFKCNGRPFEDTIFRKDGPNATLWEEVRKLDHTQDHPEQDVIEYDYFGTGSAADEIDLLINYPIDNDLYSFGYTLEPGVVQCIANQTYKWGFSYNLIYLATIGNAFWVASMYGIWVHVNRKSELCKKGRRLWSYRAAIDMAEAVGQDLGPNICAYSDKELETALRRRPPIKYAVWPPTDENCTEDRPAHIGLSRAKQGGAVDLRFDQSYGHL